MGNSPLATVKLLSPNRNSPRNHAIDTVTIHCFVGQVTAKRGCEVFQPTSKRASCNYVVGYDGSIGLCVNESDRSWCSSSSSNDNRAITIEVASEAYKPYAVTVAAYNALIDLLVDICIRNNIPKLLWKADKNLIGNVSKQNMTVHRWFANKECPGAYLYERMGSIADEVNARLGNGDDCTCTCNCPCCDNNGSKTPKFSIGEEVTISKEATVYGKEHKFASWVYNSTLYVRSINGDRAVVSVYKTGAITGAVETRYLMKKS